MAPEAFAIILATIFVVFGAIAFCWALDRRGNVDEPFSRDEDWGDRP